MDAVMRHVLLINLQPNMLDMLSPLLREKSLDIHTVDASPFVLDLIRGTPFEILIVHFPLEGMDMQDVITAVREPGSMCRNSGFILLTEAAELAEAIPWMGHGVNRIVMLEWPRSRIWETIEDLLDVAARVEVELPVQVALPAEIARDVVLFKTANLSHSGALLSGFRSLPEGTVLTFSFQLPGEEQTIHGAAEVVRKADRGFNGIAGIGIRFLSFEDNMRQALRQYIEKTGGTPGGGRA